MSESGAALTFIMSEQSLFSLNFLKIGCFLKVFAKKGLLVRRIKEHKKLKIRTYSMSRKMSGSLIFWSERERSGARIILGERRAEQHSDFL